MNIQNSLEDTADETLRKILLQKAEYWRTRDDDPHNIAQAVSVSLMEFESALSETLKLHPGE